MTGTLADNEDPDEIQHYMVFYQVLHCFLLDKIDLQTKKYNIYGEIITSDPSIYRMDHSNFMEKSISTKLVK